MQLIENILQVNNKYTSKCALAEKSDKVPANKASLPLWKATESLKQRTSV